MAERNLDPIVDSVRHTRNTYIIGFLFIFGFGVLITVLSIMDPEEADVPGARGRPQGGKKSVVVQDVDRKGHSFNVKTERLDEVMALLQSIAPRATVGFSDENNKKYREDPFSLIRDAEG